MDFEAAFPSVEHGFMMDLFAAAGWPPWLLNFLRVLHHGNSCRIALNGALFSGFTATRGIRQGCPLSPSCWLPRPICSSSLSAGAVTRSVGPTPTTPP